MMLMERNPSEVSIRAEEQLLYDLELKQSKRKTVDVKTKRTNKSGSVVSGGN
jgi:hypothetical protein